MDNVKFENDEIENGVMYGVYTSLLIVESLIKNETIEISVLDHSTLLELSQDAKALKTMDKFFIKHGTPLEIDVEKIKFVKG